jgi:glucokinase
MVYLFAEPRMHSPVVLGVDFGGSKVAVGIADPSAQRLGALTITVRPDDTAQRTFDRGVAAAHELLAEVAPGRALAAVGACTFGIPRMDGIDLAPNIAGWEHLAFGDRLRLAFPGAEIRMATDVKAAALAEAAQGALAGCDPGLYVNLGTGLAVAIVVDGVVVTGRHGAAGEIGYNLRHPLDPASALRLEQVVSGKALAASATQLVDGDVAALFERARIDPRAAQTCAGFVAELAFHLVNVTIAVDPERVVVGGGMVRAWERLHPPLAAALAASVPFPPELTIAAYPFDAPLVGVLALAADAYHERTARRHLFIEGAPA